MLDVMEEPRDLIADDVKGLIFDCDGTLVDTMPLHWQAWCQICEETGLQFNKKDFLKLAGVPGKYIIRELAINQCIELDPLEVYQRKKKFFQKGLSNVAAIPCVFRYVYEAKKKGIPIAVASGSSRFQVERGRFNNVYDIMIFAQLMRTFLCYLITGEKAG